MKCMVIGTDGSPRAREAVEFGLEIAAQEGAEVFVVHVLSPVDSVVREETNRTVSHPLLTADDDPALRHAAEIAAERLVTCSPKLLVGLPEDELLALAREVDAGLIVVGSRGTGSVKGALLGSVSRGVLNRADRPVLIVKGTSVAQEPASGGPAGQSSTG
jgi:nucleotide-binding universal stress UspA family protein